MVTYVGSVEVSTSAFEFAHGKKPRGFGMWGFYFGHRGGTCVDPEFAPQSMNYAAAKRWAVSQARARGFTRVVVGS